MQHRGSDDQTQQALRDFLATLSPEERLQGLSPEKRLEGLSPEERLRGLTPEELERLRRLLQPPPPNEGDSSTRHGATLRRRGPHRQLALPHPN